MRTPRVTVGLPTYNRAGSLPRAIESVLAQTYRDFELVISDNASTDTTPEVCRRYASQDTRVRVLRQPRNLGLTGNFNAVFAASRGVVVMVLADDDHLEPDYLERCLAVLDARPDHVVVSGGGRYFRDGALVSRGVELQVGDDDPAVRVRRYLQGVRDNVSIYGLMRTEALRPALPMQNRLAGDWLLIARVLMAGKLATVPETWVNRSAAGTSESFARTVRTMHLTPAEERAPTLSMARFVFADIARDAPVYAPLGDLGRRRLGCAGALAVLRPRWLNIIEDALRPLLERPRLHRVDAALRRVARHLQRS